MHLKGKMLGKVGLESKDVLFVHRLRQAGRHYINWWTILMYIFVFELPTSSLCTSERKRLRVKKKLCSKCGSNLDLIRIITGICFTIQVIQVLAWLDTDWTRTLVHVYPFIMILVCPGAPCKNKSHEITESHAATCFPYCSSCDWPLKLKTSHRLNILVSTFLLLFHSFSGMSVNFVILMRHSHSSVDW